MIEIFEKIGNGRRRVLVGHPISLTSKLAETVEKNDVLLYFINAEFYSKFYNALIKTSNVSGKFISALDLDKALANEEYKSIMSTLLLEIQKNKISHALLNSNMWHPNYLSDLKKNGIVLVTKIVDDPEGSKYYSEPVVRFYDKCICSGVYYDKYRKIEEMYYKWGAKKVRFLPVFVDPRHYDDSPIDFSKKDIDIVHTGSFNWKRWISLSRLNKNFAGKMRFYSYCDPRKNKGANGFIYKVLNVLFPLPEVCQISDDGLKNIYKRSKIGFNRHLSFGPSNARSYELCLNGVLQIADNPKGYETIYTVGKDIICYKNIKEAIKLIKYYLDNNVERERIARSGYKKSHREYTYEAIFDKHLKYILEK